jgi:DNA replication protein DnaC
MTIAPQTALAPVLRRLKLTGMLDTLDARLAEARAPTLGTVEFLQTLCEDELARRKAAAVNRRLRGAHLPSSATLEGFDFSFNPKLPAPQIRDLARLEFVEAGEGLCIYGPVGGISVSV